jgi:hypothetical protein
MLNTIIAGIILVGVLFAAMAVGVVLAGKRLRGSCGGVGAGQCDGCGGGSERCKNRNRSDSQKG